MAMANVKGIYPLAVLLALVTTTVFTTKTMASDRIEGQFIVFGTIVSVTVTDADNKQARQAISELEILFNDLHHQLHPWLPGPLADLNRNIKAGETYKADQVTLELIEQSKSLSLRSDGRFNPAIGELVDLWGFHLPPEQWQPPSALQISTLLSHMPKTSNIQIQGTSVFSSNPNVKLDFGGIAKGYAIQKGLNVLLKNGISNAMINAGGDLGVIGQAKIQKPWRVAIRAPQGSGLVASLDIRDGEVMATSGNYERFHSYQGVEYSHLIDPLNGMPTNNWTSVTVLSDNGALSDAAATALAISDIEDWQRIAHQMEIRDALLIDSNGKVHMTDSMSKRILTIRQHQVAVQTTR